MKNSKNLYQELIHIQLIPFVYHRSLRDHFWPWRSSLASGQDSTLAHTFLSHFLTRQQLKVVLKFLVFAS